MPTGGQRRAHEFSGARMRELREAAQITLATLASRTGVAEVTLVKYEGGRREPSSPRVIVLARALRVKPTDLLIPVEADEETLRHLRAAKGLRQTDVAERSGIRRSSYAALERGEIASLGDEDCAALARVFGTSQRVVRAAQATSRAAYISQLASD